LIADGRPLYPAGNESPGLWAGLRLAGSLSWALGLPKPSLGLSWAQAFRAGLPGLQGFETGCAYH